MVNMFATKIIHKLPLHVSPVPDANALNIDALNIYLEGLDGYAFCRVALIPKIQQMNTYRCKMIVVAIQQMNTYRCKMIVVAPGWPMIHCFWDLVNGIKTSITATSLASETAIQSEIPSNLLYWNLHVWHLDTTQNHLNHSLSRWQRELRHLKDSHLENFISQGGPF